MKNGLEMGSFILFYFLPLFSVCCKCVVLVETNDKAFRLSLRKSGINTDGRTRQVVAEKRVERLLQKGFI